MSRKSNEKMALLKQALKLEFPSFILTEGVVSGDPVLTVNADATPATTEENAYIKIVQRTYTGFPTPSLASSEDGRTHIIQLAVEGSAALATRCCWTAINFGALCARLKDLNCEIEVYMSAAGVVPVEGTVIAINLKGSIRADVRHPNSGD